jgi:hypothetical protein
MARRSSLRPEGVADLDTLTEAFARAAKGRSAHPNVARFRADLSTNLTRLGDDLRAGVAPVGRWTELRVFDPKPRRILAPCFADRVVHHALMLHAGPVIDRALVADTLACRAGKGSLAAVLRAQQHVRRFPWFVKLDVRAYFASIQHDRLRALQAKRFRSPALRDLFARILERTPDPPGVGLPIGALTSQYFANLYLDGLDRHLLEAVRVRGFVRYMDDVVCWVDDAARAREVAVAAAEWARADRGLCLKPPVIGRSVRGVSFLGFRVLAGALRLSLRRKRRYRKARVRWEAGYREGRPGLQAGYAAALGVTAHAHARAFRRADLVHRPPVDA